MYNLKPRAFACINIFQLLKGVEKEIKKKVVFWFDSKKHPKKKKKKRRECERKKNITGRKADTVPNKKNQRQNCLRTQYGTSRHMIIMLLEEKYNGLKLFSASFATYYQIL